MRLYVYVVVHRKAREALATQGTFGWDMMTSSARRKRRVSYLGESALGENTVCRVEVSKMRIMRMSGGWRRGEPGRGGGDGMEQAGGAGERRRGNTGGPAQEGLTSTDTFFHRHRHRQ